MPLFTSSREKHLWIWGLIVYAAIFSTLFFGQPLARIFGNQNIQAAIFMLGMLLVGAAILVHALWTKPSKIEIAILLGIAAVYIMFILRLGLPERSHLIEYSVLAIVIHKAVTERVGPGTHILKPALIALTITFLLGVFDESMQIFLPNRVFDPVDIFFNGMAATMAIASNVALIWLRKLKHNLKSKKR
ncbi:MAG: VanZ family protein [Cyclobacteriaceae bacterium]